MRIFLALPLLLASVAWAAEPVDDAETQPDVQPGDEVEVTDEKFFFNSIEDVYMMTMTDTGCLHDIGCRTRVQAALASVGGYNYKGFGSLGFCTIVCKGPGALERLQSLTGSGRDISVVERNMVITLDDPPYNAVRDRNLRGGKVDAREMFEQDVESGRCKKKKKYPLPRSYALDRVNQLNRPLDNNFSTCPSGGQGVDVYVLDGGCRVSHQQFGGRARNGGSFIAGGDGVDRDGHGTHVAALVGGRCLASRVMCVGTTTGSAPRCNIICLQVLGADGSGSACGLLAALDAVGAAKDASPSLPIMANLSLGGPVSTVVDTAIERLVARGVPVVVAAGNDNQDACHESPARTPNAITVGSTDQSDKRSSFSNFGRCVDVYVPGSQIRSAWYKSDMMYASFDGTSMAAPIAAGAIACILALPNNRCDTHSELVGAIRGTVTPRGTTQRLIYSPPTGRNYSCS